MEKEGFLKKEFDDEADVYVINTCSVTDNADKECRQLVRRIHTQSNLLDVHWLSWHVPLLPGMVGAISRRCRSAHVRHSSVPFNSDLPILSLRGVRGL